MYVAANPSGFVTITSAFPTVPAGTFTFIWVASTNDDTVAAFPPIVTFNAFTKFWPCIVIISPPASKPDDGVMLVITGGKAFEV